VRDVTTLVETDRAGHATLLDVLNLTNPARRLVLWLLADVRCAGTATQLFRATISGID
jgi:hypothetical protein